MHSLNKRTNCEGQKGDGEILAIITMVAAMAGAVKIINCDSVTLDDLEKSSPELARVLRECGGRFEGAVHDMHWIDQNWDCWLTDDGKVCDYRIQAEEAEDRGWISVVDSPEPEPDPRGIAEECRQMAADAGLKPCLGQHPWNWQENGGFIHPGVPNRFCPAS